MKTLKIMVWALLASLIIIPIALAVPQSQVEQTRDAALAATNEFCSETGRNEACYGHTLLDAEAQAWVNSFSFGDEGDIVDVAEIQSLRLSGMDVETGLWGVALMNLRANLPDNQPEDVRLLLFGNVELENMVGLPTIAEVEVSVRSNVNVRRTASTQAGVIGTISPGEPISAVARLEDSSWVQILMPESGQTGWVSGSLIRSDDDLDSLNVVQRTTPHFGPMQAFLFRNGPGDETDGTLSEIPTSGLLIQTPEGAGRVDFFINEVNINLGSTVLVQTSEDLDLDPDTITMEISLLEGSALVVSNGVPQGLIPGTMTTVPLNAETLQPIGSPTFPEPWRLSMNQIEGLPVRHLLRPFGLEQPPLPGDVPIMLLGGGVTLPNNFIPPGFCGEIPGRSIPGDPLFVPGCEDGDLQPGSQSNQGGGPPNSPPGSPPCGTPPCASPPCGTPPCGGPPNPPPGGGGPPPPGS